ncbi:MAG: A/G-specific adenine glycosylase [Sphingobacteriaceae bacterium]|jgi:A/G-specific adenine glycosylase|nr:A/G-specific adenine glycosylase [Sphingobacteriaceae bacterium]
MNFAQEIIAWYQIHKRDLPWRNTNDPYMIWLSEIILQQTRVEQGTPYFHRFSEKYPTVADFAAASEAEILKLWQGLGYYSRGRNMHHTANMVMEEHDGYFPKSYDKLIKLKGVGEYTAAAISSFAGNEAKAVVDGNVFRLLSRYFGINTPINSPKGKKEFTELANQLIDASQPGLFNQGIMEFGSLQCKPQNPLCGTCPLRPGCQAYNQNRIQELPVKLKNSKVRSRYFNYVVAIKEKQILMNKRGSGDIWENLYDLPLLETSAPIAAGELITRDQFVNRFGNGVKLKEVFVPAPHLLSHQKLHAQFLIVERFEELFSASTDWFYIDFEQLGELAQPKLIFAFFKKYLHSIT